MRFDKVTAGLDWDAGGMEESTVNADLVQIKAIKRKAAALPLLANP
jgi:hypothetical protein